MELVKFSIIVFFLVYICEAKSGSIVSGEKCTLKSINGQDPPVMEYWTPIEPSPGLAMRTCDQFYPSAACCDHPQTLTIQQSQIIRTFQDAFGSCPACTRNLWAMWCGFWCSPFQANYVNVTQTNRAGIVEAVEFFVYTRYANSLYDSCKYVQLNGSVTAHEVFPTYQSFFSWIASASATMNISVVFYKEEHNAFLAPITDCDKSCSCSNCNSSCHPPPELDISLNSTMPTIVMFDQPWSYVTLILSLVYLGALLIFFFVISLWFPCMRFTQLRSRIYPIWIGVSLLLGLLGIGILLSSVIDFKTTCGMTMFDSHWNCYTLGFALAVLFVLFITPILLSIYYYVVLKHLGKTNDTTTSWQQLDFQTPIRSKGWLQLYFFKQGHVIASNPMKVIAISLFITGLLGIGMLDYQVVTSPELLWMYPQSRAVQDRSLYEELFGPVPRVERMFVTAKDPNTNIFSKEVLFEVLSIQNDITNFTVSTPKGDISFQDLCMRPLGDASGCKVDSPLEYWQSNEITLQSDMDPFRHIDVCTHDVNLKDSTCLNSLGTPIFPNEVLGGFKNNNYTGATALILTFLVSDDDSQTAEIWESGFLDIVSQNYTYIHINYAAQSSMQQEIERVSKSNHTIIIVSFCCMFVYISIFALAKLFPIRVRYIIVDSKFSLGLAAMCIVLCSWLISLGLCSLFNLEITLFINVILPFLILAVGLDNMFILVDTLETTDPSLVPVDRIAEALSHAGSSMLTASLAEALTFLLGCWSKMPAVKAFAVYAGVAVIFNFILQTTCFVAFLTLDLIREETNRVDCFPCVALAEWKPYMSDDLAPMLRSISRKKNTGVLRVFAERFYGPFILHPVVKAILALSFLSLLLPSIYYASTLPVGLDQREFLPVDNYVVNFMNASDSLYTVGPALYITPVAYDYTDTSVQNSMCDVPGCSPDSLLTWFQYAPYISSLPNPENSWIDSYFNWAAQDTCCLADFTTGRQCLNATSLADCEPCFDLNELNRPNATNFAKYLPVFLGSAWQENCSTIGQTFQYDIAQDSTAASMTGRFKLYYTVLTTQDDYINAIKTTYELIDNFNGTGIIAYSDFFIYYEQFLSIRTLAVQNLLLAGGGVFFITLILLGNPVISACIVTVVAMIEIDVLGAMAFWKLSLNPVSLVNLLMAVGVSLAFCVHIGYAWTRSTGTAHDRAYRAVVEMFSVVFSGITMGKVVLVVVLGLTSGAIFKTYYFYQYLFILILAFAHSLLFLPVLLSLVGTDRGAFCLPQQYKNNMIPGTPHQRQSGPSRKGTINKP